MGREALKARLMQRKPNQRTSVIVGRKGRRRIVDLRSQNSSMLRSKIGGDNPRWNASARLLVVVSDYQELGHPRWAVSAPRTTNVVSVSM
jgi:hypothetical protein